MMMKSQKWRPFQDSSLNAAKLQIILFRSTIKSSERRIGKIWPQAWLIRIHSFSLHSNKRAQLWQRLPSWSMTLRIADLRKALTNLNRTFWITPQKSCHRFVINSPTVNSTVQRQQLTIKVSLMRRLILRTIYLCCRHYPKCHRKIRKKKENSSHFRHLLM